MCQLFIRNNMSMTDVIDFNWSHMMLAKMIIVQIPILFVFPYIVYAVV